MGHSGTPAIFISTAAFKYGWRYNDAVKKGKLFVLQKNWIINNFVMPFLPVCRGSGKSASGISTKSRGSAE
jgi:hypothetical protein